MPKPTLLALLVAALAFAGPTKAENGLKAEASAFLRANAGSPVAWLPWGEAAIAKAKSEQKPVFLFVGSFASELSGTMRRQTFANPKTAGWLNDHFVCVLVDRDERPDVAALFQSYVGEIKQLNGWPLNVWLTPDFLPYEGATYLSPSEDWGAPGFLKLANEAAMAWSQNPAACRKRAGEAVSQLASEGVHPPPAWNPDKTRSRLAASALAWKDAFDAQRGGFGDAPKNPEPELVRFLLTQSPEARSEALATLRALASSALRDPLDGGFFRYANDLAWRIPYPQKTLADQARIALAFLDGAKQSDDRAFERCARGAIDFALDHLHLPNGTYAATLDATGDDDAGYFSWTEAQIDWVLRADSAAFKKVHAVESKGNVPLEDDPAGTYAGKNFLRCPVDAPGQAAFEAKLLANRTLRPLPPLDERSTAGANGLFLCTLSRAGMQLGDTTYVHVAGALFSSVKRQFLVSKDGTLRRFAGSQTPAAPEDYAALAQGCIAYSRASGDLEASTLSQLLRARLDALYLDGPSGRYFEAASPPGEGLFLRPLCAGDPPGAENLAVALPTARACVTASALSELLEESSAQAPGDQLLGLELYSEISQAK